MTAILSVSGSPSATSRTARLLRHLDDRLRLQGHDVTVLDVRTLPADALLAADFRYPAIAHTAARFERADGIVIGTPVYKGRLFGAAESTARRTPAVRPDR